MSADNQTQFRANWFAAVVEVYGEELADIEHDRQHREGDSCEHCPKTGGGCNQCR
jgi:hypothetical protein